MAERPGALAIERRGHRVEVVRAADGSPVLTHEVAPGRRPFIHPLHAPGGGVVTENAPGHHPWQHGLYVGLNDVNGAGFWSEGLDPRRADTDGTFDGVVEAVGADGDGARWTVRTDYFDPAGEPVFDDRQDWRVTVTDAMLRLDVVWTLNAPHDVVFGEYPYGGLFLRMPFRGEGSAVDSEGQSADGMRARWVAVTMPLPDTGGTVTAALLDHPGNPGSPVPWRIDNELGIAPSPSIAGAWTIPAGESRTFRYRLAVADSALEPRVVHEEWARYSEGAS